MTVFVEKDNEVKKIQTEDLSYFIYKGYKLSDKKEIPAEPVKRGRKRFMVTEETEENNEIKEE